MLIQILKNPNLKNHVLKSEMTLTAEKTERPAIKGTSAKKETERKKNKAFFGVVYVNLSFREIV